jgi:hypothetical protein
MSKFTVIVCDFAAEAARIASSPVALEAQARREIAMVFGADFALKSYPREKSTIRLYFTHAEEGYIVFPLTAGTWCIETSNMEPPCPPYPIVFTDRATAMIVNLGWQFDDLERTARRALKDTHPEDYGFCDFRVPLEEVAFRGSLNEDNNVEIDLDDLAQYLATL